MKVDQKIGIVVILLITLLAYVLVYNMDKKRTELLNGNCDYVIGLITEKRFPTYGDPVITFKYRYKNEIRKHETSGYGSFDAQIGERYFVCIPLDRKEDGVIILTEEAIMLLDIPVPEKLLNNKEQVWKELPNLE